MDSSGFRALPIDIGLKHRSLRPILERFMDKVAFIPEHGCWEWIGASDGHYGVIVFAGKKIKAHRISWSLFRGEVPPDMTLDHLCRNRTCVNPEHLEPVTKRENIMRGTSFSAHNAKATHCAKGHEFSKSNTRILNDGRRLCVACNREWNRARYWRDKREARADARET